MTNREYLIKSHHLDLQFLLIKRAVDFLELEEPDMAVSPQAAALITEFDTATTAIANRIAALVAKTPGISAEDQAAFQAEVDKLTALGSDPNNPVPVSPKV